MQKDCTFVKILFDMSFYPSSLFRSGYFFAFIIMCTACEPPVDQAYSSPSTACPCNSQTYLEAASLFTQVSSEYKALCLQAYRQATEHLPELAAASEQAAVVLDLDETVLENSPYTAWQVMSGEPYSPATWDQWVQLASAEAVPGAAAFLRFADSLGLRIFYISNREESQLEATITNMRALKLPQVEPSQFYLKSHTSDKSERRRAVIDAGYDIVMLIGDNLGDFHNGYDKPATNDERDRQVEADRSKIGREYIVLPNTLYGTWEGAIYGFDRSLSDAERCMLRSEALRPAPITGAE